MVDKYPDFSNFAIKELPDGLGCTARLMRGTLAANEIYMSITTYERVVYCHFANFY